LFSGSTMSAELRIRLLGNPAAFVGDEPVTGFVSIKSQALLYYLAATEESHRRDVLAALLWSDVPDATARRNLRDILSNLRQLIGPFLAITRQNVSLNPDAQINCDSQAFLGTLTAVRGMESSTDPVNPLETLAAALDLYKGEFLAGFYVPNAPLFEEWMLAQRAQLQAAIENSLEMLVSSYSARREYKTAIRYALMWSSLDPLQELPHRALMQLYAEDGDRPAAMKQYQDLLQLLEEELGVVPAPETTSLFRQIRDGDVTEKIPEKGELTIRGYELRELINDGHYAAVYRAYQPMTGRNVAIKVIQPQVANQPEFIRRFELEAQLVATVEHPHIVPLYDYWREPDCAFLVMRWLAGGSLEDDLQGGAWELAAAGQLLDQISAALATAHRQGVVHRDIKPANILLDENKQAFLSDFGIARYLGSPPDPGQPNFTASSPEYASPEQLLGEPATPSTDIYSLGIVLYETLVGAHSFHDKWSGERPSNRQPEPMPSSITDYAGLPDNVAEVIRRATAKDAADRYPDALSLAGAFRQAAGGEVYTTPPLVTVPTLEVTNPYKGLRAFQESDAADFYGRESQVKVLVSRLCDSRFLAVVGPSGGGKSSLIKAGLLPALRRGAVPGSETWFVAEMTPGENPLQKLELALLPIAVDALPNLLDPLQENAQGLLRILRRILPGKGETQLLLVIDQFEELFTLVVDDKHRLHFLNCLLAALDDPHSPLRVVVTLRADFYDRPLQNQPLAGLFKQHTEIVLPLDQQELAEAIREPARRMGVGIEEDVVTAMVTDVTDQPGALPLLQYTLTELFDARKDSVMTLAAYQSLGGVAGALTQRAEEIYAGFDEEEQAAARQMMLRLVTLGEGIEDTRRRVLLSELESILVDERAQDNEQPAAGYQQAADYLPAQSSRLHSKVSTIIHAFGRARLLTFDRDPSTREPTVEVAHEALLREWDRLRQWLEESRADVRQQRLLAIETAAWLKNGQDDGYLLRGARLDQYKGWPGESSILLTAEEQAFLAAGFAAREARLAEEAARQQRELRTAQQLAQTESRRAEEQARAADRLRRRALILAAALVIAALLALAAIFFAQQSNQNATVAADNARIASTREAQAATEAEQRATAQGRAEEQADVAMSRELAATALNQLSVDPERSILLALYALSMAHTLEAENALHQAIQSSRVLRTLRGHTGPVFFLAFSPDGSKIATTSEDGTAKVWDAGTGQELLTLAGHLGPTIGLDFSPDGKRLATSSYDGTAIVWNALSGERLFTLVGHESEITSVHFSPDGRHLVTNGQYDGQIKIWDAQTGAELGSFSAHQAPMWYVTYSPDGERLATASVDRTAKLWDANTFEELVTLGGHEDVVSRVNFSPDGERLATSSMTVRIWDAVTGEQQLVLDGHTSLVLWVDFSPDGKRIATTSVDGKAKVWDAFSGEELFTLSGHSGVVLGLSFNPDGTRLGTASFDGSARIWDLTPEKELRTITGHDDWVYSVAFNPEGTRLLSGSFDGTARVWDVADPTAGSFGRQLLSVEEADPTNGVRAVAFSPDGSRFIVTNAAGGATVHDAETGRLQLTLRGHAPGQGGETTYDGITGAAFSPDGELIATASDDLTAKIWDAFSGKELMTLQGHVSATATNPPFEGVVQVAFNPEGTLLATAGADGTVKMWSTEDGRKIVDLPAHPDSAVIDLAFSPDGSRLATGAFDGTTKLWRVSEALNEAQPVIDGLDELFTLIGHTSWVNGIVFTPDGSRLVTASEDGTAKVWDTSTGQELLTLTVQPLGLLDIAITPDGRYLATAGRGRAVRLFVLPTDELISLGQSRVTRSLTEEECQRYLHLESCPSP